jgi:uncharacterized protein YjiS (DUF1127 family)
MRYERPRQGDAIAAPARGWFAWGAENEHTNFVYRPTCSTSITSMLTGLWSRIRRHREIHRIKAAWGMIDDRTLGDIGVSRYEIEYARDARYRR